MSIPAPRMLIATFWMSAFFLIHPAPASSQQTARLADGYETQINPQRSRSIRLRTRLRSDLLATVDDPIIACSGEEVSQCQDRMAEHLHHVATAGRDTGRPPRLRILQPGTLSPSMGQRCRVEVRSGHLRFRRLLDGASKRTELDTRLRRHPQKDVAGPEYGPLLRGSGSVAEAWETYWSARSQLGESAASRRDAGVGCRPTRRTLGDRGIRYYLPLSRHRRNQTR